MKCKICDKEVRNTPNGMCKQCRMDMMESRYCPVCGKKLSNIQAYEGSTYCSRECFGKLEQARRGGKELCARNHESTPWWNYKNSTRFPGNKLDNTYLYVVSTSRGLKVGLTSYYYKRIEEVTRSKGNRREESYVYCVYLMPTLDATYLESYIHRVFQNENEYHRFEDLEDILAAIENPRAWTLLNDLKDDKNPNLTYPHIKVFEGTYAELEEDFKTLTDECNLSMWTVPDHKEELHDNFTFENESSQKLKFDETRLFELHDGLITHNCRLQLNLKELRHRNGGLFGAGDSTGSIGVVTINLPRLGYENRGNEAGLFASLDHYLEIARDSLEIKREWIQKNVLDTHLIPAYIEYVGTINNHFSTIGVCGMNEMCENFCGKNILDEDAKALCLRVSEHIRQKLLEFQNETGHLYNYEATPAESTCVSGDTLVQTTEGNIPIRDLVGRDDVSVICYDMETQELKIKRAYDIRKTGTNKSVVKVTFDNGQSEIMTPHHLVAVQRFDITGRGETRVVNKVVEWRTAEDLQPGESVISNYLITSNGFCEGYYYCSNNKKPLHRFVYEQANGEIPDGYIIHHKDGNKKNNRIDNLEMITPSRHKALHWRQDNPNKWQLIGNKNNFYGRHHTEKTRRKISLSKMDKVVNLADITIMNDAGMPYESIAKELEVSCDTIKRCMKRAGIWASHTPNHKVVSIEYLDEKCDVYNMEVEDCEDYFIGGEQGILVHNCYRFALHDRKKYPDIITRGEGEDCYYTNSCHIPVNLISSINETFAHQNDLQIQFTGGTVIHVYLDGAISGEQAKTIVKEMFEKYRVPYMSLSPISRYCDTHGYVREHTDTCPVCGSKLKMYQRITGYLRCVDNFNRGKKAEFRDRIQL